MDKTKNEIFHYLHDIYWNMEWSHPMTLSKEDEYLLRTTLNKLYVQLCLDEVEPLPICLKRDEASHLSPRLSRRQQIVLVISLCKCKENDLGGVFHGLVDFIENYKENIDQALSLDEKRAIKTMIVEANKIKLFSTYLKEIKNNYDENAFNVLSLANYCRVKEKSIGDLKNNELERFKI